MQYAPTVREKAKSKTRQTSTFDALRHTIAEVWVFLLIFREFFKSQKK